MKRNVKVYIPIYNAFDGNNDMKQALSTTPTRTIANYEKTTIVFFLFSIYDFESKVELI